MSSKEMGIKLDAALAPRANHSAAAAAAPILASHSEISAYYSFVHLISTVGMVAGERRKPFAEQHYLQKYLRNVFRDK